MASSNAPANTAAAGAALYGGHNFDNCPVVMAPDPNPNTGAASYYNNF